MRLAGSRALSDLYGMSEYYRPPDERSVVSRGRFLANACIGSNGVERVFIMRLWYNAVRGFLALAFLNYGIAKLFDIQFNPAYQPAAFENVWSDDLSGFQLAWRFFNHSRLYQWVIGCAEVGAAALLLSWRTSPLGAVLYYPVIVNVVLVDVCFGIHRGATVVALSLLCGDLLLLAADWRWIRGALAALLRSPAKQSTQAGNWRSAVLGWALAVALTVAVAVVAAQIGGWH
jgi:hypothetical protein